VLGQHGLKVSKEFILKFCNNVSSGALSSEHFRHVWLCFNGRWLSLLALDESLTDVIIAPHPLGALLRAFLWFVQNLSSSISFD
jgi:hypothetical protein